MKTNKRFLIAVAVLAVFSSVLSKAAYAESAIDILRQGLLGAGVGAISAEVSGGKAGKGALIGAGTSVIGGALLNMLTGPSTQRTQAVAYPVYQEPVRQSQPQYVSYIAPPTQTYTTVAAPVYAPATSQADSSRNIIRQGILGAGVGAISASTSGGKAGQGALIGAGTNVIGGALMDTLFQPSTPSQPVYYSAPLSYPNTASSTPKKHIIRKFDAAGNVISEEEYWS